MRQKIVATMAGLLGIAALVGCTQLFVAGQNEQGQDEMKQGRPRIEGVWQTVVTVRNCATGLPLPIPQFPGILMFSKGGTITGTSTALTSVYGVWGREPGRHKYSFSTLSFRYDAAGERTGSKRITQNVTLDENGNALTSNGVFQDYDVAGNPTISGCSTATGTRFE